MFSVSSQAKLRAVSCQLQCSVKYMSFELMLETLSLGCIRPQFDLVVEKYQWFDLHYPAYIVLKLFHSYFDIPHVFFCFFGLQLLSVIWSQVSLFLRVFLCVSINWILVFSLSHLLDTLNLFFKHYSIQVQHFVCFCIQGLILNILITQEEGLDFWSTLVLKNVIVISDYYQK